MPKYINADALTKRIDEELCKPCRDEKQDYNGVRCRACWVDDMLIWIDSEPEVTADVREVILCKDCKHASPYRIEGTIFCEDSGCPNLEDGFCNHAERRGDE